MPQWIKTMNPILQKRIEEAARECDYQYEKEELAFISGGNYALENQWISVDEALPEKNTMCFVRKETEVGVIYDTDYIDYEGKWFFNFNRTSIKSMVITHWMEILSLEGGEE